MNKAVSQAMQHVSRAEFLPEDLKHLAHRDSPLPIGEDQTISQPSLVALMTDELHLNRDSRVLEIGTGCGFQTAILAEIAREVYTIEVRPSLSQEAQARLEKLGYTNIYFRVGDGTEGWKENAPYDAIIVTAAALKVPEALAAQLGIGGRMVIPIGSEGETQQLTAVEKKMSGLEMESLIPVRFVPIVHHP